MLTAMMPAHNEAATIQDAVRGLMNQTTPPDEIIVVADNCTDDNRGPRPRGRCHGCRDGG